MNIIREFVHTSKYLKLFRTLHRSFERLRVSPHEPNVDQDRKEATSEVVLEGQSWHVTLMSYPSSGSLHITDSFTALFDYWWFHELGKCKPMRLPAQGIWIESETIHFFAPHECSLAAETVQSFSFCFPWRFWRPSLFRSPMGRPWGRCSVRPKSQALEGDLEPTWLHLVTTGSQGAT